MGLGSLIFRLYGRLASPEDHAECARTALVAFLAETLRAPKGAVRLKGGRTSRLKQVEVQGLDLQRRAAGYWRPPVEKSRGYDSGRIIKRAVIGF